MDSSLDESLQNFVEFEQTLLNDVVKGLLHYSWLNQLISSMFGWTFPPPCKVSSGKLVFYQGAHYWEISFQALEYLEFFVEKFSTVFFKTNQNLHKIYSCRTFSSYQNSVLGSFPGDFDHFLSSYALPESRKIYLILFWFWQERFWGKVLEK